MKIPIIVVPTVGSIRSSLLIPGKEVTTAVVTYLPGRNGSSRVQQKHWTTTTAMDQSKVSETLWDSDNEHFQYIFPHTDEPIPVPLSFLAQNVTTEPVAEDTQPAATKKR